MNHSNAAERLLKAAFLVQTMVALGAGCGGDGGDDAPDGGTGTDTCPAAFAYRPNASASSVFVAGEWNGYDRSAHKMSGPDATGSYTLDLDLPPGEWKYFFLVDGVVTLDPEAETDSTEGTTYSKTEVFCGGTVVPTSLSMSVDTASVAKARTEQGGSFSATVNVTSKGDLSDTVYTATLRSTDGTTRDLDGSELSVAPDKASATISLSGLADGKYTVRIKAANSKYQADAVLPFWIEEEDFNFYHGALYMVMTDRFRNGDTGNDDPVPGSETPANFQGGDLNGITQAINEGYFGRLGVRSLWITPWQTQPDNAYAECITYQPDSSVCAFEVHDAAYHGYWPTRAREVEPRFGGEKALHELVQAAHAKGIRVIMDTVLNHVHEDHEYMTSHPDWFRTSNICKEINWSDPIGCMFTSYMPDINWTKPETADQFLSDVEWWVETFDLDGLRVDAVKHMEDNVMGMLGTRMRKRFETAGTDFFMFGETYDGSVDLLNKYIGNGQLDGQFDFRRYFDGASNAFLNDGQGLADVNRSTWDSINSFGDAMMVTFIGSHDVPRVISRSDPDNVGYTGATWGEEYLPRLSTNQLAYDRVWMAMVHMMTTPGVPLIYYGDEYGEHGGSDPDNRHFMKTESQMSDQQKALLDKMRRLGAARNALRGLQGGRFETMWVNGEQWGEGHGNLWAFVRWDPKGDPRHNALVVMNLTDNDWSDVELHSRDANSLKLSDLGWTSGTVKDYLSGAEYQVQDAAIKVTVPRRGAVILGLE